MNLYWIPGIVNNGKMVFQWGEPSGWNKWSHACVKLLLIGNTHIPKGDQVVTRFHGDLVEHKDNIKGQFATRLYSATGSWLCLETYATWDEAEAGHVKCVALCWDGELSATTESYDPTKNMGGMLVKKADESYVIQQPELIQSAHGISTNPCMEIPLGKVSTESSVMLTKEQLNEAFTKVEAAKEAWEALKYKPGMIGHVDEPIKNSEHTETLGGHANAAGVGNPGKS